MKSSYQVTIPSFHAMKPSFHAMMHLQCAVDSTMTNIRLCYDAYRKDSLVPLCYYEESVFMGSNICTIHLFCITLHNNRTISIDNN